MDLSLHHDNKIVDVELGEKSAENAYIGIFIALLWCHS
jgi:hypothetical protein